MKYIFLCEDINLGPGRLSCDYLEIPKEFLLTAKLEQLTYEKLINKIETNRNRFVKRSYWQLFSAFGTENEIINYWEFRVRWEQ